VKLIEEKQLGGNTQETTKFGRIENKAESQALHKGGDSILLDQGLVLTRKQALDSLGAGNEELSETAHEEAFPVKVWYSFVVFILRWSKIKTVLPFKRSVFISLRFETSCERSVNNCQFINALFLLNFRMVLDQ
jgi:hypothetical protein